MSRRTPTSAIGLVVAGMLVQEVGASLAVTLFPHVGPAGMTMLRLVFSAIILLAVARPSLRGRSRRAWLAVIRFAFALVCMNTLFYFALQRLPLGVAVTIEVLGPLVLSIVAARRASAWMWAVLALAGVAALGGGGWNRLDPLGVVFILGAAAAWAWYILSSARAGREFAQLDGLALAMALGAVLSLPLGIWQAGPALLQPVLLAQALGVAVLSSTIPYTFELIALRRVPAAVFAIFMAISPATASLAGFVLLGQSLTWLEIAGMVLVIAASIGAVRSEARAGRRVVEAEPLA